MGATFKRFNLSPRSLLPNLFAGAVSGLVSVTYSLSFAALIFSGNLSSYLSIGIQSALVSAVLVAFVVACSSSFPFAIAGPDSNTSAILALMASAIATRLLSEGLSAEIGPTIWAALVASALLSSVFLVCLSQLQLGNFVRFIPYPVIGGFLAGAGWLIFQGAFSVATGVRLELGNLAALVQSSQLIHWLPSLGFALLLKFTLDRVKHSAVMPTFLVMGVVLTYGLLASAGMSLDEARLQNWLFSAASTGGSRSATGLTFFTQIHWSVLLEQTSGFLVMMAVLAIAILLNATGLELVSKQDIDINRELKACGIANLAAGLGGGMVGYLSFNRSVLNRAAGGSDRSSSIVTSLVCAVFLFLGTYLTSYIPKPVLAGLLFYIGLSSLKEWLYDARFRLPAIEYGLIVLIVLIIAGSGFLQGVGAGLVIACLVFAFNYSRTPFIHLATSGVHRPSNFERSFQQQKLLRQEGEQIYILCLQGYIFFGTANTFLNHIRQVLAGTNAIQYLVLDFRLVSGLDSSAASSFTKLRQLAQKQGLRLVFTHLQANIQNQLIQTGGIEADDNLCQQFPDLDRGIEWCEEQILQQTFFRRRRFLPLALQIGDLLMLEKAEVRQFMHYFEPLQISTDQVLFEPGEVSDTVYFLENGQVSILTKSSAGEIKRLQTLSSGTVLGEIEFYQNTHRSVIAIADKDSSLYYLSRKKLQEMQESQPQLAAAFHQFVARLLADRLFPVMKQS